MIQKKLIHFNKLANFKKELANGNISDKSIVYIKDSQQIWTHGQYYGFPVDSSISSTSTNPVQNKVVKTELDKKQNKLTIDSDLDPSSSNPVQNKAIFTEFDNMRKAINSMSQMIGGFTPDDMYAYGVQWTINQTSPALTRIGNKALHQTLPIQNALKGCIIQKPDDITGVEFKYWLDETDWRFRKNPIYVNCTVISSTSIKNTAAFADYGYLKQWIRINGNKYQISSINTSTATATFTGGSISNKVNSTVSVELGSRLNGYDGVVKVHCPKFYIKSSVSGTTNKVFISTIKIDDTYYEQPEVYIDAFHTTILRSVPSNMGYLSTLSVGVPISVMNTNTYCRGGNNDTSYDTYLTSYPYRTLLGKPATYMTIQNMRTQARNMNSHVMNYSEYKNIFYWLYVIEYANFNSQLAYNANLTADGFKQGGLGNGVTNMSGWSSYNNYFPVIPCGNGVSLGNKSGIGTAIVNGVTMYINRWRGFDCPFGNICTVIDNFMMSYGKYYKTDDYIPLSDNATVYNSPWKQIGSICKNSGYIKSLNLGDCAEIVPSTTGGSSTTYMCDYAKNLSDKATNMYFMVGGSADEGQSCGFGYFRANVTNVNFAGYRCVTDVEKGY